MEKQGKMEKRQLLGKIVFSSYCVFSTQDWVKQLAQVNAEDFICIADMQTAGRGRRGKKWFSSKGNIFFSFSCYYNKQRAYEIGFRLAVAVCETLSFLIGEDIFEIRWPNDILCYGKKVAGVLVESISDERWACGMGIDISGKISDIIDGAISLEELGFDIERWQCNFLLIDRLNAVFLLGFDDVYIRYMEKLVGIPGMWKVKTGNEVVDIFIYEVLPTGRIRTDRGDFDYLELVLNG